MKLERQISIAFTFALILFIGVSALAYFSTRRMVATAERVAHTNQVMLKLEDLLSDLQEAETGQRGYLITGRESYLEPYNRALTSLNRNRSEVRELTRDNPEQQQRLDRLERVIAAKLAELKTTIDVRRSQGPEAAARLVLTDTGKQAMDAARGLINELKATEQQLLAVRTARTDTATRRTLVIILIISLFALALITTALLIIRSQLRRIRQVEIALQEANTGLERQVAARTVELRATSERLRVTLGSIGDAVIATDDQGRVDYLNQVAEALTGWTMADARGHALPEVFHIINETTRAEVESPVVKVLREGVIVGLANHTVLLSRDGREVAIDDSGAPIRDAENRIQGAVLVFRDIGEKRKAELERDRFFTLSLDLLCISTTMGRFRRINPAFTQLLGWTEEEMLGKANLHFVHPDDRAATIEEGNRILDGHTSRNFENRYRSRDGSYRVLSWTAQPLLSEGLVYSVARDVTEQKAVADELARRARLASLRAEVAGELAQPGELAETLKAVCETIVAQLNAAFARIWTLNDDAQVLELQASAGRYTHLDGPHSRVPVGQFKIGRIAAHRAPHLSNDVPHDPEVGDQDWARREGMQAFAGYPLIVEERLIGVVALFARAPLSQEVLDELAIIANGLAQMIERKRAEETLRLSEARYRVLTEVSPQTVWTARADGYVDYCNQYWLDYTGLTMAESEGQGWTEAIDPDHRDRMREAWIAAATTGGAWRVEIPFRRASDGQYRWHLAHGRPLRNEHGEILRWVGVASDIHDRKLAEEELEALLKREQRSRQEAEEAGRLKDEFLAVVSHELRTPLNAINGYTQLLRGEALSPETTSQYLATIDRNAKSQMRLIEDLLDVSRIITGKLRLNIARTDLRAVATAALEAVQPAAEAKHLELALTVVDSHTVESDHQSPIHLMADPARLQQVIWNLLSNAVKFTPKRGAVNVELRRVESRVEVEVRDTGEGIAPDFLPYVFDRFRQADSSSRRTHSGLGLGLAIVRHLVELHGGDAAAFSEGLGRGASFVVRLPIKAVVVAANEEAAEAELREELPDEFKSDLTGLRVLAVDDEADSLEMISAVLRRRGAEVTTFGSAQEALLALAEVRPDIIVSDIGMPEMNGHDFIRAVRALEGEGGKHVPAIALTAYASAADRVRAFSAGFQFHLAKPVEPTELVVTVASMTERLN